MSSQKLSLQICVTGGEADGMEKSISILRTYQFFTAKAFHNSKRVASATIDIFTTKL